MCISACNLEYGHSADAKCGLWRQTGFCSASTMMCVTSGKLLALAKPPYM